MIHLAIDSRNNSVVISTDSSSEERIVFVFSRRWEALLLACLLEASSSGQEIAAGAFQALIHQRGQSKPLNRAQWQRLLQGLQSFLDTLPGMHVRIESPPRKQTVGPWRLSPVGQLSFCIDGRDSSQAWPHPSLVQPDDADGLLRTLSILLVGDALAVEGRYAQAIEVLQSRLEAVRGPGARAVILLRLCSWYKHSGHFEQARRCALEALALPCEADPGVAELARFFLQRIDYDENPAEHWPSLWQTTSEMPGQDQRRSGADWRTLSEWHNLRALLARRSMHKLAAETEDAGADAARSGGIAEEVRALHRLGLGHLQAAIYMAAWYRDWDRLQAYVANLAYHLQSALVLANVLNVQASQVLDWHRLTMAYEDKLSAGRDSAWEYIFFGKFWLDHHKAFNQTLEPDPLAHHLGNCSPDQEAFYQRALVRLRECGDDRQVAIGHSLYIRFAAGHLAPELGVPVVEEQTAALRAMLVMQRNDQLVNTLVKEGYAADWPPELQSLIRRRRVRRIQEIQK